MIVVQSSFSAPRGAEAEVRRALSRAPPSLEAAPGFLGLRLLADPTDGSRFALETSWTDVEAFDALRGTRPGPVADPAVPAELGIAPTAIATRILEPVSSDPRAAPATELAAVILRHALPSSSAVCVAEAHRSGLLTWCNAAFAETVGLPGSEAVGQPLDAWLTAPDAVRLRRLLERPGSRREDLLLNFVGADDIPVSLSCHLALGSSRVVLVGEPLLPDERELRRTLLELGDALALALRENERSRRSLAAASEALERDHWHLRKVAEVLPFCMRCHRVKAGETGWEDVVTFLRKNSEFLSHGYCPRCEARLDADGGER